MVLAHNALIIATCQSIFLGLAWIFVLVRLYIRKFMVHGLAIDDYFLFLTTCLYTIFAAVISVVASVYIFNHPMSLVYYVGHLDQVSRGVHYFYLAEIFYVLTAALLRVTVGLLLLRIAHTRNQRIAICVAMLLMVLYSAAFLGVVIFQCSPVAWYWDYKAEDIHKGHCDNRNVLYDTAYVHAGISLVSDWILGLLPIWLLWNVQISRNKKIGVACMLSLGLICGVAAIVRVKYIPGLGPANFETHWIGLALCSVIEPGLGIIAAALAAVKPVFATQWFQNLTSRSSTPGSTGNLFSGNSARKEWKKEKGVDTKITGTILGDSYEDGTGRAGADIENQSGIRVQTEVVQVEGKA